MQVDMVAHPNWQLTDDDFGKLKVLIDKLEDGHFPSFEEMQSLRAILSSDELKTVLEREKTSRLWAKVRLQFYRTIGTVLATLAAAGAAYTFLDALYRRMSGS